MYYLSRIVAQTKRRRLRPIKVRPATSQQERALFRIYQQVVDYWRRQVRDLEPRIARPLLDAMPNPAQLEEQKQEAEYFLSALIRQLEEWTQGAGAWTRKMWIGRIKYEYNIDIELLATNQAGHEQVVAAVEWATALIRDLSDSTRNKLVGALAASAVHGVPPDEVAMTIKALLDTSERRAKMIAHDQTQKIFAKLNELQQREAGIEKYVWNHSFLPNPRRHHVERQGNVYSWDKPPRGGHPGTEINCRCTAAAVLEA